MIVKKVENMAKKAKLSPNKTAITIYANDIKQKDIETTDINKIEKKIYEADMNLKKALVIVIFENIKFKAKNTVQRKMLYT